MRHSAECAVSPARPALPISALAGRTPLPRVPWLHWCRRAPASRDHWPISMARAPAVVARKVLRVSISIRILRSERGGPAFIESGIATTTVVRSERVRRSASRLHRASYTLCALRDARGLDAAMGDRNAARFRRRPPDRGEPARRVRAAARAATEDDLMGRDAGDSYRMGRSPCCVRWVHTRGKHRGAVSRPRTFRSSRLGVVQSAPTRLRFSLARHPSRSGKP